MISLYPSKFAIFCGGTAVLFVLVLHEKMRLNILVPRGAILLVSILAAAAMFYAIFSSLKKSEKTTHMLTQQCNPQVFVQDMLKMWKNRQTNNWINVNLSGGYYNLGRFDLMKQSLDACTAFKGNFSDINTLVAYLNNQIVYHAETMDFAASEQFLMQLRAAIDKPAAASKRDSFYLIYAEARQLLLVQQGNFEGAEDTYLQKFDRAKDLYGKVFAQWMLARTYLAQNRLPEAKIALEYVAQNGGGLCTKQLAVQELATEKFGTVPHMG